jgi:hypothetical protein
VPRIKHRTHTHTHTQQSKATKKRNLLSTNSEANKKQKLISDSAVLKTKNVTPHTTTTHAPCTSHNTTHAPHTTHNTHHTQHTKETAAETRLRRAEEALYARLRSMGFSTKVLQGAWIGADGGFVLGVGAYAREPGPHPLQTAVNGKPQNKSLFRLFHTFPKLFCDNNDLDFSDADAMGRMSWVDIASYILEGDLPSSHNAPHKALAKDAAYCKLKLEQLVAVVGVMFERNGNQRVLVLNMCPEAASLVAALVAAVPQLLQAPQSVTVRHTMQFGGFLRQAGTEKDREAERAQWDKNLTKVMGQMYRANPEDVVPITPWNDIIKDPKSKVLTAEEQKQFCFGGASGTDPVTAGTSCLFFLF